MRKQVGKARADLARDLIALINTHPPEVDGLVRAAELLVLLQPGERTWRDVTRNPTRRVGLPCDDAELSSGDVAASGCENAYIAVKAISPDDLGTVAAVRREAAPWLAEDGQVLVGRLRLTVTDLAFRLAGPGGAVWLLDVREDPDAPTLMELDQAGARPDTAEWKAISTIRKELDLLGFVVRPSTIGLTVILNVHVLELLVEAGLLSEEIAHDAVKLTWLQRLQRATELYEVCVQLVVRLCNANEDLGIAVWKAVRAWLGGGGEQNGPVRRGRAGALIGGSITILLGAISALLRWIGVL